MKKTFKVIGKVTLCTLITAVVLFIASPTGAQLLDKAVVPVLKFLGI